MFDSPPGFKPLPKYHLSLELQEKVQVPTECPSTKASQGVSDCGLIMPLVNPEAIHRFEKTLIGFYLQNSLSMPRL